MRLRLLLAAGVVLFAGVPTFLLLILLPSFGGPSLPPQEKCDARHVVTNLPVTVVDGKLIIASIDITTSVDSRGGLKPPPRVSGMHAPLTVVTMHSRSPYFDPVGEAVFRNRLEYSDRFGLSYLLVSGCSMDSSRSDKWGKVHSVLAALGLGADHHVQLTSDWVWWLDADALIMNPQINISSVLLSALAAHDDGMGSSNSIDLVFTKDSQGLNSGSFFIRVSAWSVTFWEAVLALSHAHECPWSDQCAIRRWSELHPGGLDKHALFIDKRLINSYPDDYSVGDFVLHWPGCTDLTHGRSAKLCADKLLSRLQT